MSSPHSNSNQRQEQLGYTVNSILRELGTHNSRVQTWEQRHARARAALDEANVELTILVKELEEALSQARVLPDSEIHPRVGKSIRSKELAITAQTMLVSSRHAACEKLERELRVHAEEIEILLALFQQLPVREQSTTV